MKPSRERISRYLIPALDRLRQDVLAFAAQHEGLILSSARTYQESACNLLHYLALRQHDIRELQLELAELGLSRLGRAEAHTLGSLNAVANALHALAGLPYPEDQPAHPVLAQGCALLGEHARALFGPALDPFPTRIMVTMPGEAATDPQLVHDLLLAGMKVMRINCAHDDAAAWLAMIAHLRSAEKALGKSCKVYADLAGPKFRTGEIGVPGRLLEFKVRRDAWGREIAPALVWLTPAGRPEMPTLAVDAVLPIADELLAQVHARDTLDVDDTRGSRRHLVVHERYGDSWLAKCHQHAFIDQNARCKLYRRENLIAAGAPGELPEIRLPILLHQGDLLHLVRSDQPGELAVCDEDGRCIHPARIPCSLDAVFDAAKSGHAIWFDDGKIGGIVRSVEPACIEVEINHAAPRGSKLWPEKGINLPDTDLKVPALTGDDIANLHALAAHIDIIGLSFVRQAEDVRALYRQLHAANAAHLGCVLKIETRQGFENLPHILLAGMQHTSFGIMLARGDLAVEIGFERLSEVQEEILCLCEAAHVPVIWATQVLETMAKRGIPSRAEVSDAALSIRAECVMLNKGPYIVETVGFLRSVLQRMSGHHDKQRPTMRRLAVSDIDEEN
ncbi:MAG: pyruvate kinase [Sideroxyarcus sp.]|nr:pyruvate kinase [Sideroxyarcus sp.]